MSRKSVVSAFTALSRPRPTTSIPNRLRVFSSSTAKMSGSQVLVLGKPEQLKEVLSNGRASVLDFTASWCGPCKTIKPAFDTYSTTYQHVNFVSIDVDDFPEIAQEYGISAMPTFLFFDAAGKAVQNVRGANPMALNVLLQNIPTGLENETQS